MIRRLIDFLTNGIFRLHPDDMQNGFMRWLLKQYKPPFHFHPDAAKDEDEEGGSAWVF